MSITTPRLRLIPADKELLKAAMDGDAALAEKLGVALCPGWTEFGTGPFEYSLNLLTTGVSYAGWLTYFPVHKEQNKLIGSCGFKGGPVDGVVEIGYEVCAGLRGQGLATEIAAGLVNHAFQFEEVKTVMAHTLPFENASTRILQKLDFKKTGELVDPDDGVIWRWAATRSELTP